MINQDHIDILKRGADAWNKWAEEHDIFELDLSGAELSGVNLRGAILSGVYLGEAKLNEADLSGAYLIHTDLSGAEIGAAKLSGADLSQAFLNKADLSYSELDGTNFSMAFLKEANLNMTNLAGADFTQADLTGAQLRGAHLIAADLRGAKLHWTNLSEANLSGADLRGAQIIAANLNEAILHRANLSRANLGGANLVKAKLTEAILQDCSIYGIAAWDIELQGATQLNLRITPPNQARITVDNLKVAQFIYLLLNNQEIRDVIDTITSKVVLILGRFAGERKQILEALRDELRRHNYSPVLFDFGKPESRDFTETVRTLAHLARFIIADLTDPSSIPHELQAIVPDLEVPVLPLLEETKREYAMFIDFSKYPWVLPMHLYKDLADLLTQLETKIVNPAEKAVKEIAIDKAKRIEKS